jgi:hypothetical protein
MMYRNGLLKLTETNCLIKNPERQSSQRINAIDKLLDKHFTVRPFKIKKRRNSTYAKVLSDIENLCDSKPPTLKPMTIV